MGMVVLLRPSRRGIAHQATRTTHRGTCGAKMQEGGGMGESLLHLSERQVGKGQVVGLVTLGSVGSSLVVDRTDTGLVWELKMVASSQRSPLLSRS